MAKKSLYDKTDARLRKVAATVGAVTVLIGAATGICSWVSNQFQTAVASQISDFQEETRAASLKNEQAVTRVELMILMEHDPDNVVAIEQMATYYFRDLGGDKYMTSKYSTWAKQHGGDTTIVIGVK